MAIAHHQDAMVQGSAALAIKYSTLIQLEFPLICFNGYADRLMRYRLSHEHCQHTRA